MRCNVPKVASFCARCASPLNFAELNDDEFTTLLTTTACPCLESFLKPEAGRNCGRPCLFNVLWEIVVVSSVRIKLI